MSEVSLAYWFGYLVGVGLIGVIIYKAVKFIMDKVSKKQKP